MLLLSGCAPRSCDREESNRAFRGYDSSDLSSPAGFRLVTCHFTSCPCPAETLDNVMVTKLSRFGVKL
jgi:hypothetical protein